MVAQVVHIVADRSYKNSLDQKKGKESFNSLELQVVQDAIGSMPWARWVLPGPSIMEARRWALYDPNIPPKLNMDKEAYKKSVAPSVNNFYEKLLLLNDKMNTKTGKKTALKGTDLCSFLTIFIANNGRTHLFPTFERGL